MKPVTLAVGSICLNIAFIGLSAYVLLSRPENDVPIRSTASAAAPKSQIQVEYSDPECAALVDKLRAASVPLDVQVAVVDYCTNAKFERRRLEVLAKAQSAGWLDCATSLGMIRKERLGLRQQLLGTQVGDETRSGYLGQSLIGVPPAKMALVAATVRDYSDLRERVAAHARGLFLQQDREALSQLRIAERAELTQTITPTEYAEYEFWNGPVAVALRSKLVAMKPTEEEVRAILDWQLQMGEVGKLAARERRTAQEQVNHRLEKAIGIGRTGHFRVVSDPQNQVITRIVSRFDLSLDVISQVNAVRRSSLDRLSALVADSTLDSATRVSRRKTLDAQVRINLEQVLGRPAFRAYEESQAGVWLRQLTTSSLGNPRGTPASREMDHDHEHEHQ